MLRKLPLAFLTFFSLSVSTVHAQVEWTKYSNNPILSPGVYNGVSSYGVSGSFDARHAWMPMVIFDNGLYKMWYVGYEGVHYGKYSIGYAVSEDGINWCPYERNPVLRPGNPGSFDDGFIWGGTVLKLNDEYRMYYGAYSNSRGKWSIGFAGSQDGIHWRKIPEALIPAGPPGSWDQDGPNAPCVMRDSSGQYWMWYSGNSQPTTAIGLATSLDGIAWSKYAGNPIMVSDPKDKWESFLVTDSRIVKVNLTYHMFYHGAPGPYGYQIGYASSTDGIHWTRYPNNPVLTLGAPWAWDGYSLSQHWVLWKDGVFKMWYGARDYGNVFQIGYATSPLTVTSMSRPTESPQAYKLYQSYPNPFNPQTIIEFEIPKEEHVIVKIFDSLGQEVATLVDGRLGPGHHSSAWRGDKFSSGVYWYRMTAGGYTETKRMMLLK
jgi:predicted GH43/DUF377 family glycosyl hydrolase